MSDRTIISFDYAILTVLRDNANFDILEGFFSEFLAKKVTITDIIERERKGGESYHINFKVIIDDSEMAVIEIQFAILVDYYNKAMYSASKAVMEQISSEANYNINKFYLINVAYFDIRPLSDYIFRIDKLHFAGIHSNEKIPFSQYDEPPPAPNNFIHPEYYLILPNKFNGQIKDGIDEWVYVFKNSTVKESFKAQGIKEAGVKLDELKLTKAQRRGYEGYLMDRQSVESAIWTAIRDGKAEGKAEGREEGLAEGREEGLAEGIVKGRAEFAKELSELIKNGTPLSEAMKMLGIG